MLGRAIAQAISFGNGMLSTAAFTNKCRAPGRADLWVIDALTGRTGRGRGMVVDRMNLATGRAERLCLGLALRVSVGRKDPV